LFIWIHFYDAHSPYVSEYKDYFGANMTYDVALGILKKKQKKNNISQEFAQDQIIKLYDGGVYSVDTYTKQVIEELESRGMLSNAIVIIASDHGENLGERNDYFHGKDVYDATTHVPLIIKVPGAKPKRIADDVSLVSITPTILDLLNIKDDNNTMGKSLVPVIEGKEDADYAIIAAEADEQVQEWISTRDRVYPNADVRLGKWRVYFQGENDECPEIPPSPENTTPSSYGKGISGCSGGVLTVYVDPKTSEVTDYFESNP
jgi:arylsulfatase A-like enzyme